MRRPKGSRTRKSVTKRFKVSAGGKVMRWRAGRRHLLQHKSSKRRRSLGACVEVSPTDRRRILANLPYGM
jgi:large subunit ribosomal protein L35